MDAFANDARLFFLTPTVSLPFIPASYLEQMCLPGVQYGWLFVPSEIKKAVEWVSSSDCPQLRFGRRSQGR